MPQRTCLCTLKAVLEVESRSSWETADEPLAKGGLNGGHPPPLPCELPMGGFPCEFGPETERKIPGHGGPVFSAHRLEGRFSDHRPHLEAPAASSRRATQPFFSKSAPLGHGRRLPAPPQKGCRRALERMACCFGGGALARCAPAPQCPRRRERKKKKATELLCRSFCALSRRSFVNNERPEVLLCESSASENRARREGRSQQMA